MLDDLLKLSGSLGAIGASIYGYSEEHKKFLSSGYKCFKCNKTLLSRIGFISANLYSQDGNKIDPLTVALFRGEVVAECPNCNYRWNMRGKSELIIPDKLEVLNIVETHRSEEALGIEEMQIDNSKNSSKIKRKFVAEKKWSKSYSVEYENIQSNGTGLNLGIKLPEIDIASIKITSTETLRKKYLISEEATENFTEEVEVEVAGHEKLYMTFNWKRIWQHGVIKFRTQNNTNFDVPFQVAVRVTFDQSQSDESLDKSH